MEENKTLLDLANEQDDTKFQEGFNKLTDEEKKKVNTILAENATKARNETTAFRAERQRLEDKAKADETARQQQQQQQNQTFEQQVRTENTQKALETVYTQLGVDKDEDKKAIAEELQKRNPTAATVDNLIKEAKKAAVAVDPDRYLNAVQRVRDFESGAVDLAAEQATGMGGGGDGSGGSQGKKYSPEAIELQKKSMKTKTPLTLDQAQAYVDKGTTIVG